MAATPLISHRFDAMALHSSKNVSLIAYFGVLQNYVDDIFNSIVHHVMLLQAGCVDLEPDA